MKRMIRFGLGVTVVSLIPGCISVPEYDANSIDFANIGDDAGVVLLSSGADESCFSNGSFAKINESSVPFKALLGEQAALVSIDDSRGAASDFDTHYGHLSAIVLDPGEYAITPWKAPKGAAATSGGATSSWSIDYFANAAFKFNLEPGQVLYLGELYGVDVCNYTSNSSYILRDRAERDLPLFAQGNPVLDLESVELVKAPGWEYHYALMTKEGA
ncbi:MAG: hypothetical protein NXH78_12550 [Hyphomonadaceae bacterium]|nr:hypothetical protein [Hyphomonadaceae bacterium]